mgnify:CR=1 FL=1|jgi:hypothetical protein
MLGFCALDVEDCLRETQKIMSMFETPEEMKSLVQNRIIEDDLDQFLSLLDRLNETHSFFQENSTFKSTPEILRVIEEVSADATRQCEEEFERRIDRQALFVDQIQVRQFCDYLETWRKNREDRICGDRHVVIGDDGRDDLEKEDAIEGAKDDDSELISEKDDGLHEEAGREDEKDDKHSVVSDACASVGSSVGVIGSDMGSSGRSGRGEFDQTDEDYDDEEITVSKDLERKMKLDEKEQNDEKESLKLVDVEWVKPAAVFDLAKLTGRLGSSAHANYRKMYQSKRSKALETSLENLFLGIPLDQPVAAAGPYEKGSHPFINAMKIFLRMLQTERELENKMFRRLEANQTFKATCSGAFKSFATSVGDLVSKKKKRNGRDERTFAMLDVLRICRLFEREWTDVLAVGEDESLNDRWKDLVLGVTHYVVDCLADFVQELQQQTGFKLPKDGTVHEMTSHVSGSTRDDHFNATLMPL